MNIRRKQVFWISQLTILQALIGIWLLSGSVASGSDWPRFRGPNGTGISPDQEPLPSTFSEEKNLQWKVSLPGAGVSCPIVVGDRVFVTCYSGYGLDRRNPGNIRDLKRHIVCLNRETGETIWQKTIDAVQPEDAFSGAGVPEHGYASHTPVSDGTAVYAFFGKSGVYAWDLDGQELWNTAVGTRSDDRSWGSSSSPIVYEDLVIVTAGAEARAIVGLDKRTGKQRWQAPGDSLGNVWGTPAVARVDETRTDIIIGAPDEIWAINPESGKLKWYCSAMSTDQFNSSVLVSDSVIYAVEGRGGGSIAIRSGGRGDVTGENVIWSGSDSNRFSTPLLYDGRLYLLSGGTVKCLDAADGRQLFQARLQGAGSTAGTEAGQTPRSGPASGGPPGARGGGGRGSDYSSPVMGDNKIYYVTRGGDIHVLKPEATFRKIATNRLTSDNEDFSATPAISNGQIFIRSSRHLYCVKLLTADAD